MTRILADSTCDLTTDLLQKYDITMVPLHIVLGDQEYRDIVEISPDEIYAWSDENKTTPKTSAVSYDDAKGVLEPMLEDDNELIIFCISEQMSTTANVFRMVVEDLKAGERVHVVDSMNLSTGIGLVVIEAAILAQEGKSSREILKVVNEFLPKVRASFVVDTMTYLHRGGRCSSVAALAGSVLKIHPKIIVSNGKMGVGAKYRGTIKSVILTYVKDMEKALLQAKRDRVFITHSGCDSEVVDEVRGYLESLQHFDEIIETRAGGVISSHCGPGTLGVLFIDSES